MMEVITTWLMWSAIICAAIAACILIVTYLHDRHLLKFQQRREEDYLAQQRYFQAREEEMAREQSHARVEESNREYMDALRAIELMEELEGKEPKNDLR